MDITVTRTTSNVWSLVDLLGRPLGHIVKRPGERFLIEPNERGQKALAFCRARASSFPRWRVDRDRDAHTRHLPAHKGRRGGQVIANPPAIWD